MLNTKSVAFRLVALSGVAAGALMLMGSGAIQSAYNLIEGNSTPLAKRTTMNFVDTASVTWTITDSGGLTQITAASSGGANTGVGLTSFNQTFSAATSVTITDNAGTTHKAVQCFDNASPPAFIVPLDIKLTDNNTTTVTFSGAQSGSCTVIWSAAAGALFRQTQSVTVANTVTETTLIGTGVGSVTLPAAFFNAGTTLKVRVFGTHSAVSAPNIQLRVKLGSTTVLDTGAVASGNSTNALFSLEGYITCRTTGATGTVFSQGWYNERTAAGALTTFPMVNTTTSTIDTTGTLAVSVTLQWGTASASDTATATNLIIESTGP
jgi:hypothetical protein